MPVLNLQSPVWDTLVGESREADWIADRTLKFGFITASMAGLLAVYAELRRRDALFSCSPEILTELPLAAYWYVCLAGFSLTNLGNIKAGPARHGLRVKVSTAIGRVLDGGHIQIDEREPFCRWVNEQLAELFPESDNDPLLALVTVAAIAGGRAIGQTQNASGELPVALLKSRLVEAMTVRGWSAEIRLNDGSWTYYLPEHNLAQRRQIQFGGRLMFEFIRGGGRPDMAVLLDGAVVAVAEVKGRKDLSNLAESWMPTVTAHLDAWATAFPDAVRLFFGTLITMPMVEGGATAGTAFLGLRPLHERGRLTAAYNLGRLAEDDPHARASFDNLADEFERLLR